MKKFILIVFTVCMSVLQLYSQSSFSQKTLLEDLDQFFYIVENSHPDPYSGFGGKMQFNKEVQRIRKAIPKEGLSKTGFQNILSAFLAKIHDGHTYINEVSPDKNKEKALLLNIRFKILTDGLIVSQSENTSLNGKKLMAVNGIEVADVLERVMLIQPCENTFGAYYAMLGLLNNTNGVKRIFPDLNLENNSIELTLLDNEGKQTKHHVKYLDADKRTYSPEKDWDKAKAPKKSIPFWYNYIDENKKVAYFPFYTTYSREVVEMQKLWNSDYSGMLNMLYKDFDLGEVPADIDEAIKKIPSLNETFYNMLTDMKKNKSTHLIIDLRENGGGWTPITFPTLYMLKGDEYFAHKFKEEYNTLISELFLKNSKQTIEEFNKQRNTNYKVGDYIFGYFMGGGWPGEMSLKDRRIKYFKDNMAGTDNGEKISGISRLLNSDGEPVYQPKVIVVCSPATFSAAFHYMYFLQTIYGATVVGVTPRQAYNNGMQVQSFTLDNTEISGSVSNSYQLFYPQDMEKGREMIPDYTFKWNDYLKYDCNKDAELLYIIDIIKAGKI